MKAMFNGTIIAESDATIVIEGNHYFPPADVHTGYLTPNGDTYECPWKGHADYYDVTVGGEVAQGSAWMYPQPKSAASEIAGHYAFWRGVDVTK